MGWHSFTISPCDAGEVIAAQVLSRANNPVTWSFENLGAMVFRQKRADSERFYFCPKASALFQPLIVTNGGTPCDSPLMRNLLHSSSSRLVLGFKTDWQALKRRERVQRQRYATR